MAEYPINKGIGRPVEFKGLKAQYLFIFCAGLLALFVLFVILYLVGIDQWICIGFGAASSSLLVWQTFAPVSYTHLFVMSASFLSLISDLERTNFFCTAS